MNRRRFVMGSAAAAGAGIALVSDGCSRSSGVPFLPGLGMSLNVQYADLSIAGYKLRMRTYNGSTVGPTIETTPGSTLTITVNNQLPPNPPQPVPHGHLVIPKYASMEELMMRKASGKQVATAPVDLMNNPHSFNTTNFHVHGVQTIPHLYDPVGTSNPMASMIAIEPGTSFTYNFPIPADHPSGLFWYHPHHHGSTDVQVANGMAGLIVIRGPIDRVPEIAAAREIFFVVQSLEVNGPDASGVYSYTPDAYANPATDPNAYNNVAAYSLITVNGQGVLFVNNNTGAQTVVGSLPQIPIAPGEVVRLRMLNGTNGTYLPIVLPGMSCNLIAFDGINLLQPIAKTFDFSGQVTQFNLNAPGTNVLSMAPGNRIEMLIQAPATPGVYTMGVAAQSGIEATQGAFNLAQFVVTGNPVTMAIPPSLPQPSRDYPLIADSEIVARRTLQFHQAVTQPPGFNTILTGFWPWINNALFDEMAVNYSPALGTAEEWTIINQTTCGHPFHLHENSFEVIEVNGVPVPPSFWDTFMVPPAQATYGSAVDGYSPAGSIKIRIRFKGWPGKTVFHCHILGHEDTGMMNNILLT